MKKECFTIDEKYEKEICYVRELRKGTFKVKIVTGVVMCILSAIPLILISAVIIENGGSDFPAILSVIFLLVIVGIAVFLFITVEMEEESYKVILQEKEFSIHKKSGKGIENIISAVYWPIIIIVYLAWSFLTGGWAYTWLIWPLAGIIFDFISDFICKIIESSAK